MIEQIKKSKGRFMTGLIALTLTINCMNAHLSNANQTDTKPDSVPLFEESELFVGGQDDINTYRIPSLICTKNGTVLAFCEGRRDNNKDGSPTHIVLKRSLMNTTPMGLPEIKSGAYAKRTRERNMTWQSMQILLHSKDGDAYMNPVPVIDSASGTIFLLVNHYAKAKFVGSVNDRNRKGLTKVLYIKSHDEGATWTKATDITPDVGNTDLGPGIGIQLQDGRLVVPVYDGIIFSDDHGKTWKAGDKTTGPVNETQVVDLIDGSLMLNTRGYPFRTIAISKDNGETWGKPYKDKTLTDSKLWGGCQANLIRYTRKDKGYRKNRLLFSNPADTLARYDITVRISYDEGKTWPTSKIIKKGSGQYSCMTIFPDGTISIIYETGNTYSKDIIEYYAKISFARFNLEWLSDGKDYLNPKR